MRAWRQIYALLVVQLLSLVHALRQRQGRRGRLLSIVLGVLWYLLWTIAAVGCALVPSMIGREDVESALPGVLLFMMGYWQLAPLVTLSLGVSLEMGKLRMYPISMGSLFVVECLLRLGTGSEMVLLLAGLFGGLAYADSPYLAQLGGAFVLFVAFNVFFSAGMRNLVERVFRRRRLREVVLVLLVSCTILPQLLIWSETARNLARVVWMSGLGIPYWVAPSGLVARISVGRGKPEDWMIMVAMVLAAAVFGFYQFRQMSHLSSSVTGNVLPRRRGLVNLQGRLVRLPSYVLPDPLGALVEKELRYLWRSPRFRLPFFMGFTFGVIAWVPIMKNWQASVGNWLEQSAVTFISLYALLLLGPVMFLNRFGFDRDAARFYFWLPLSFRTLLLAKNLTTLVFATFEIALVCGVCLLIGLPVGIHESLEAFAVGSIALLYLVSVGNHMSVRHPVASNPDRISRAGPGHGLRATVQFMLFPLSLLPLLAAYVGRYRYDSIKAYVAVLVLAAAGGVALYLLTLSKTVRYGRRHRELLLSHLTPGGAPIVSE
jgi:ABC-2 type transport system permease protein